MAEVPKVVVGSNETAVLFSTMTWQTKPEEITLSHLYLASIALTSFDDDGRPRCCEAERHPR